MPPTITGSFQETLREARLCGELGMDMLWLAEDHFDGVCAYVDPVTFAAALAASTRRIRIGFAVAQMSLHHPIRMAEQMALIDNISEGRLVVGRSAAAPLTTSTTIRATASIPPKPTSG